MFLKNVSCTEQRVRDWVNAGLQIMAVVPCYNVEAHIAEVVRTMPDYVHAVILVDDSSQDQTGALVDRLANQRVHPLHLPCNQGVGSAVLAGFARAAELGADIIVKMDGDGQMDPYHLPMLVEPLVKGKADYAKGNRFWSRSALAQMPIARQIGNAVLSFLTKLASGYWNIFDPTNGYTAIRREVLEFLPVESIHRRYFFESSMLIALGTLAAVVCDVPMPARYGSEESHLRIGNVLFEFPWELARGFVRRVWLRKFLYSLTMEAILGGLGLLLMLAGTIFGVIELVHYNFIRGILAPSGTVMTAALPVLLGFQMIMNALLLDIQSVPTIPLCEEVVFKSKP
jgi:glycosyltransferase involved in cell wall biosynthesis